MGRMTVDLDVAALASAILVFVVALVTLSSGRKIAQIERVHALAGKLTDPQKKELEAVRDDLIERYARTHRDGVGNFIQMIIYAVVFVIVAAAIIFTAVPGPDGYWPIEVINAVMVTYFVALAAGLINSIVLYARSRSKKTRLPASQTAAEATDRPAADGVQSEPADVQNTSP